MAMLVSRSVDILDMFLLLNVADKIEGFSLRIVHCLICLGWCHMTWICYAGDFLRILPW